MGSKPRIEKVNLHETAQERYLNYAMSVITSRALPDVRDGLKPVQRRILYSMYENLNLDHESKPRKSAAIVGDVMGKYHPHGDQSIYDAMVRMAQSFSMRQRLVDGYGNFGSLDGDGAAAMRYTEAKLTAVAGELLDEIDKNTVDFRDNYDGTEREPTVLPAQVPNLLVNGATGIAVGMATNIPPHNLVECLEALIALIDDRSLTIPDLLGDTIRGPDFPTGGVILNSIEELREIYDEGSGTINLRAEWESPSRTAIVINSVPYTVNKAKIVEKIANHIVKGNLPQVKDVRDESTDEVRIKLELKRDTDHKTVMAYLFKHTKLEYRFHVNMTTLVPPADQQTLVQEHDDLADKLDRLRIDPDEDDGEVPVIELLDYLDDLQVEADPPPVLQPASVDLKEALTYFLDFRMEVYVRSLVYDLEQILARIHILEAFEIIFDELDKAIELIRASESKKEAGQKLRDHFDIDYDQSEAILQTRLYRLARLEIEKIRRELEEKREQARKFKRLLTDEELRWEAIKQDFEELHRLYSQRERSGRFTRVEAETVDLEYTEEAYIEDEDVWVMVSEDGWLKRQKSYSDLSKIRCRDNDTIGWVLPGRTPSTVIFFTNMGRAYTMRIDEVPSTTGYGDPLQAFFDFEDGEKVVGAITDDDRVLDPPPPEQESLELDDDEEQETGPPEIIAVTESGRSVRIALDDYTDTSTVRGRMFMRLEDGDRVVNVEQFTGNQYLVLASRDSRGLIFDAREVNFYKGNAKGVLAIRLEDDDDVLDFTLVPKDRKRAGLEVETNNGAKHVIRQTKSKFAPSSRGNKGRLILKRGHLIRSHRPPLEIEKDDEDEDDE